MRTKPSRQSHNLHGTARRAGSALVAFVATLLGVSSLTAQTGTISGRVIDSQTAQPIASAQVVITQLSIGSLTQQNGRFVLQNVPPGAHVVSVQRIGYQTVEATVAVEANGVATQDFAITQTALSLDEIIITGTPGGTQRRAIGNSVARVSASDITEQAAVSSIQGLLSARTPGVRFGRVGGEVGSGSPVTIRGVSSVSLGSQPLIYIDGIRVDNDATKGPETGSNSNASALGDLNPDEIESIEVIKGPAAATLYGTEASAGVIQIITKRGAIGAPEFTLEVTQGTNFMRNPGGVLGTQYTCKIDVQQCPRDEVVEVNMYQEANDYLRHQGRFAGLDLPFAPVDRDLFGNGHAQRYNLSVRGGTEQVRYFLSGSYSDDVGIIDYNTDNSANLRANITVLLTDNLNVDVSTGFSQGESRFATVDSEGGVWHQLVWSRPQNLPGVRSQNGSGFLGFQERWPQNYEETDITREYTRFTGSMTATHTFQEWLSQRLVFGIDKGWDTNTEFLPAANNFPEAQTGYLNYGRPVNQNVTFDYAASAMYRLNNSIGTKTSFGAQYYSRFDEFIIAEGKDFPTTVQRVIDQTGFGSRALDYSSIQNKTLGFYVQEELSWQDRLFLTAAVRADDNSAFGAEFDLQYYPKLSASWVISEEDFFNVALVDNLQLRSAWGRSGRQPGTFASQTLYATMLGPDGNGLFANTAGNPEIGPEVSTELEVGFNVALLNQRLSGEFSYYTTTTEDMLVNQSLAPSTGLTGSRQANLGTMNNHGWEASLNARIVDRSSLAFDLLLSADFTKNEIVSLGEDILPTGNFQIGWPFPNISSSYIIRSAEFNDAGQVIPASVMCDGGKPAVAGGPNIMLGGETIPCSEYSDAGLLLGPAFPNYSFAVGPTLTIGNSLQVFALAEGQFGRWIASTDANYACRFYFNCLANVLKDDPMFRAGISNFIDDRYNGRYSADFWKLRQLGVRYTIPQSLVGRFGADRASISVSGNNLVTLWQRTKTDLAGNPIYDPEYSINGDQPQQTALWEMPGIASVNASIRVTF